MTMKKRLLAASIAAAVIAAGAGTAFATASSGSTASDYNAVASTRLVDTRTAGGPVKADGTLVVSGTANGATVPAGATAVNVTITVVGPTAANGDIEAYADGTTRPALGSNVNFVKGQTVANLATVPVVNGKIDLYNYSSGTVQIVVDLEGYYTASAPAYMAPAATTWNLPAANQGETINTGGSAATRSTDVGTLTLNPGTYLLNVNAKVTPIVQANADTQISPSFFVYDQAISASFTGDLMNFGGSPIESGANANIDSYFSASQIVTVTAPNTTLHFISFGYDNDRGEGTYELDSVTVTATPVSLATS